MSLYLDIPYQEKDEAKALGAKWNPKVKKWYADCSPEKYVKFSKWLLKDSDETLIALDEIYIIEGHRKCWKCGRSTRVIGLGLNHLVNIYGSDTGKPFCELYGEDDELHLAWVESEEDIPPKLLAYLKNHYSIKTGFSKTIDGKCFANHCDCCGALQGNWFLFNEPDSPLSSCCADENELKKRIRNLKIKAIPLYDDLQLYWNVSYCSGDFAYLEYGNIEEVILTDNKEDEEISYQELYYYVNDKPQFEKPKPLPKANKKQDKGNEVDKLLDKGETNFFVVTRKRGNIEKLFDINYNVSLKMQRTDNFYDINDERTISNISSYFIKATSSINSKDNLFFDQQSEILLKAFMFYLFHEGSEEDQNFTFLLEFLREARIQKVKEVELSIVDEMFCELKDENPNHIALLYYYKVRSLSSESFNRIVDDLINRFEIYDVALISNKITKAETEDNYFFECKPFEGCYNKYELRRRYKNIMKQFTSQNTDNMSEIDKLKTEAIIRYINIEYEDLLSKFKS